MNSTDPEPLTSSLATQDKLRDMRAHLDTMTPQLVHSADGRIMMAAASMPEGMVTEEDYPLTTPKLKLSPIGQDPAFIDQYNASIAREIESKFDGYGLNTMEGADGNNLLGRCCTVAMKGEAFQVIWSGARRQWVVLSGEVRYLPYNGEFGEYISVVTPKTYLDGIEGWITLPITFLPQSFRSNELGGVFGAFEVKNIGHPVISVAPASAPPKRTITQDKSFPLTLVYKNSWGQGNFHFPLARVVPPGAGHKTPKIDVCFQGVLELMENAWAGTFPEWRPV